jgi:RES domain-containing protein
MTIYRICRNTYPPNDPAGAAMTTEGRRHRYGQRVLYCSSSLDVCILEMRANGVSFRAMREGYHYTCIQLRVEQVVEEPPASFFAGHWRESKTASQQFGSDWYGRCSSLLLAVPSTVLSAEHNYLVHAGHHAFGELGFSPPLPVPLDTRLA